MEPTYLLEWGAASTGQEELQHCLGQGNEPAVASHPCQPQQGPQREDRGITSHDPSKPSTHFLAQFPNRQQT